MNKKFMGILTLLVVCFGLGFGINASAKTDLHYTAYTLNNGLQVVIIPHHRAPVVYHSLWYKVGSADSPSNKTGLAHYLEHMMFKGTSRFPGDTLKRKLNELGAIQNAMTDWDTTQFFITASKEHLPVVMELEADRMQNLILNPNDAEKELEVVLQERRQTVDANPDSRFNEAINARFFQQHPYSQPVIGTEKHIRSYTPDDVKQFYNKWYAPNNAILVIAGDISVSQVKSLVNRYYGSIPKKMLPERIRPSIPQHRGAP